MPLVLRAVWYPSLWRRWLGSAAFLAALSLLAAGSMPGVAAAEGINGYVEAGYSSFGSENTDAAGAVSRTDSRAFAQRYNLLFNRSLAPYLRLYASGLFDKIDTTSVSNGARSESTTTTTQPTVDLTLRTPVYLAGIKFSRRMDTAATSGSPETTSYNDFYQGILGWKPPDRSLPSIEMRLTRSQTYDKERLSQNIVTDFAGLTMEYAPIDTASLRYRPTYIVTDNRINGLELETLTHAGVAQYSDRFLQNRVSFGTSYNFAFSERQVSVSGTGAVDIGLVPFAGLSSIDDTPGDSALVQNAALIDGNLTASAGINIGLPPLGGDSRERNIGLDFSFAKEVNRLLLWVDRALPVAISNSFSWSVYTSSDNVTWSLLTTVFPAPFGTFDNRFDIGFSAVTTRYIKVVVKPLSSAVNGASGFPDIFVTELQAFSSKPADQVRGKSTSSSQIFNIDGRALLLEKNPNLYYTINYLLQKTDPPSRQKWALYNALQATHRFDRVFSGSATVGREDFDDSVLAGHAYLLNASLDAVPLRALHHTLTYSGRSETRDDGKSLTNNLFLNNTAHVYTGVYLTAGAGLNISDQDPGGRTRGTDLRASANIEPHRTLGLNYTVVSTYTEQTGGGQPSPSVRRTDNVAGASYHPVETLYLVYGHSVQSEPQRTLRLENYGLNWSPYLGSSLQFAFVYSESLSSEDNAKTRLMSPSMVWKFARTATWTVSYQLLRTESDRGRVDSNTFSTSVRAYF